MPKVSRNGKGDAMQSGHPMSCLCQNAFVGKKPKSPVLIRSTVSIGHLTGRRRGAIVKEEIVHRGAEVLKYSLAYINPRICGPDNGRVSGMTIAMGTTTGIPWGRFLPWTFLDTKRSWTALSGK